jgi:uncharacterized protein (DUF4415 family)
VSDKRTAKRSPKRPERRKPSRGQAQLSRLRRLSEAELHRTAPAELPELPANFWTHAQVVAPAPKVPISLRVDRDVLEWFRETGAGYQSRMNAVLRSYMQHADAPRQRKKSRRRTV